MIGEKQILLHYSRKVVKLKSASQNYRPVSLTSVICKLMESIIKDEIIKHFNIFKLINGSQHRFTKGRSCLTNLLEFFEEVTELTDAIVNPSLK